MAKVTVLTHPAAGPTLAALRDRATEPDGFRTHARRLGALLTIEAITELPMTAATVTTPLTEAPASLPDRPVVAVPVLRAGLGLLPGVHDVVPSAAVGMVGLERDEATLEPRQYYAKVPELAGAWVLVLEPMLATGGSASAAVQELDAAGAERVTILSVVATQSGIDRVVEGNTNVGIVVAAIDPGLDDNSFIVPGLGDFGDRLFGTPDR